MKHIFVLFFFLAIAIRGLAQTEELIIKPPIPYSDTLPKTANELMGMRQSKYNIGDKYEFTNHDRFPYYMKLMDSIIYSFEQNSSSNNKIDSLIIGQMLIDKSWFHTFFKEYEKSLRCLRLAERLEYPQFELFYEFAGVYYSLRKFDTAALYYQKDIAFRKKYNWHTASSYYGLGFNVVYLSS
ncbi:MAG: hypothetical protein K2X86_10615 [Cytophagaceae bacterium]|nr:hypothetical protein [Cytophagaceae bacterium]